MRRGQLVEARPRIDEIPFHDGGGFDGVGLRQDQRRPRFNAGNSHQGDGAGKLFYLPSPFLLLFVTFGQHALVFTLFAHHAVGNFHQSGRQSARSVRDFGGVVIGKVFARAVEHEDDVLADQIADVGAVGHNTGVVNTIGDHIDLIEQERRERGNGHDQKIAMLDVPELVRQDGIGFSRGEDVEQTAGNDHASITARAAKRKCVRCAAIDDAKARDFEAALGAKLFNKLAIGFGELGAFAAPGDVQNPLNDVGRDQVLEADEGNGKDNGEPQAGAGADEDTSHRKQRPNHTGRAGKAGTGR